MSMRMDWTARSWVASANDEACGLPLQSLPYCSFRRRKDGEEAARLGVGIGAFVMDLHRISTAGLLAPLDEEVQAACRSAQLNALMRCGRANWSALRQRLFTLLREDADAGVQDRVRAALVPMDGVSFALPVEVGDYTDFYASVHHATNVGKLFRPDQPLLPNYAWVPIGYHGRASSLVVSGTEIRRPSGQYKADGSSTPTFQPTQQLDYELEVAAYVGTGNELGTPVGIEVAEEHLFGLSLLNDWSARDVQAWEAQPLGPFLGKNFATSVSPWVVPMEALEPYRAPLRARSEGMPGPLPYLDECDAAERSGIDLQVEVYLSTSKMQKELAAPCCVSTVSLLDLHWTFAQMLTHHASNGCNLRAGDLIASGTVSGPEAAARGCLLELTERGAKPLTLPNGEMRAFLEDGDEVILRGFCQREGFPTVTLGECRGCILLSPRAG